MKKILGLDLGSNSLGWALLNENSGQISQITDVGVRIFNKSVEEKVPTPKNQKRRDMRLGRRIIQRRARRKQRLIGYLVSLNLLPPELLNNFNKEGLLNSLGDVYYLRTKALDDKLEPYELGRVLLHFVSRRGFLSSKKQVAGDLIDDPDTLAYLHLIDNKASKDKEEGQFKEDIKQLYSQIKASGYRTLGEYLYHRDLHQVKRNRAFDGGHLRTDRAMYKDELSQVWQNQQQFFDLPDNFISEIEKIIFYQRPLKLNPDRIGKCSLEPKYNRANIARLEVQQFRYLQDINNLEYFERQSEQWLKLSDNQREKLQDYFENNIKITITKLKQALGLDKPTKINLEAKNFKGNTTACYIREIIGNIWNNYDSDTQKQLVEDLLTIKQKSALKKRLINHWKLDNQAAIKLAILELEQGHSNHSLRAINKLLPFLKNGDIYSDARQNAGYDYEKQEIKKVDKLPQPPETSNPIVNKSLHELKRVVNAIIKEYGKPDIVRIEMARDLEMNTKRYKDYIARQNKNQTANKNAEIEFLKLNPERNYANKEQKLRYRLWQEQDETCPYSGKTIALSQVWSDELQIDHILPYKKSLDDSYMNKVLCFAGENQNKQDKTPIDAFGSDENKWNSITHIIESWDKSLRSKVKRFYTTEEELQQRDFIKSQLNDTRYISKLALEYISQLDCQVDSTKGSVVALIRHIWGFNNILGDKDIKERTDHRHHAIDAVIIGCTSRSIYQQAVKELKNNPRDDAKLHIIKPYATINLELQEKLDNTIISHAVHKKITGALHEETGAGYSKKHKCLVYRKTLNPDFTIKNALNILDEQVKTKVLEHISNYDSHKIAFNEENLPRLKLGKNNIKRVRVLQSKTTEQKLKNIKFGVKDKSGKVFKYMSYGNNHHIEIIKNIQTVKIKAEFVTMMEATKRARIDKLSIVNKNHGNEWQFIMDLCINDIVSIEKDDKRVFYRVQKLGGGYDITLRLHTASTLNNKNEEFAFMINTNNLELYKLKKHRLNAIGYFIDD
jgi:CRISPR-associated endonuclease Csn1